MTVMVRDLPADERPREKLLTYGASSLGNAELLAILLRTGTQQASVLHIAEEVLARYRDRGIVELVNMAPQELAEIKGVGLAKAATVVAAIELGRRLSMKAAEHVEAVHGPEDAARYAIPRLRHEQREHFVAMLLDRRNHILAMRDVSIGNQSASVVHPREVFRLAIQHSAASLIVLHNHPSGDPTPSQEDVAVTQRLVDAGKIMDIPVLDHIVLGGDKFISLKEEGMVQ